MPVDSGFAGTLLAGVDPITDAVAAGTARPRAIKLNPQTRDFYLDANGRYVDIHPVDAAVVNALVMLQGRIKVSPQTGWTGDKMIDFWGDRAAADASARVRTALKQLTDSGDVSIDRIEYQPQPSGPFVRVWYFNNRLLPRKIQDASASL